VSFEEAATVFGDQWSLTVPDPAHSEGEERFITFGRSAAGRTLVVAHTDRADSPRIIAARDMTPAERRAYERN